MDIQSVSRHSLAVTQLVRAQVGTGRISLPVSSNQIYANFKHITGIGGSANQPSFSISQLRSLDNLIDRLKLLKGDSVKTVDLEGSSENSITTMIETFREELHTALQSSNNPYKSGVSASGISIDLFV